MLNENIPSRKIIGNVFAGDISQPKLCLGLRRQTPSQSVCLWVVKESYSLEYMQGLFRCIFILLLRANNSQSNSEQKYGELHNAVFYIRRHFRENITLTDVAKYTSLSKNYFCERFHTVIGTGFNAYLNNLRTDYSAHLLSDTNESIIDICYESGFSSFSSFSRLFKTKYGITPSEYRKIKKKNRSF